MLEGIDSIFVLSVTVDEIIGNTLLALICGVLVALVYRFTYKGPSYSTTFVNSLVLLAMITAIVIMVIGNNLARAFGLVGAMSIIRFRTAVKETQDIVFVFFSLAIGMAAGAGLHVVAVTGTVLIGAVFMALSKINFGAPRRKEYLLQFTMHSPNDEGDAAYLPILKQYCKQNKLINMKSTGDGEMLELSFYVSLKDPATSKELVQQLRTLEGIERVNLFFDEES